MLEFQGHRPSKTVVQELDTENKEKEEDCKKMKSAKKSRGEIVTAFYF